MMNRILTVLALSLLAACAHQTRQGPEATARALYEFHFSGDMGFTPAHARGAGQWMTAELTSEIDAYFAAQRPADEVPPINGDPFTDSQEYPDRFAVGRATIAGSEATVPVTFPWPDGTRTVELTLRQSGTAWLVDDIRYSDGRTFREMLRAR